MQMQVGSMSEVDVGGSTDEQAGRSAEGDIVADVAHSLRNHFHRLYYWIDVVREQRLDDEGAAALGGMAAALQSVERLSGGVMTLTRPIELGCIRMSAEEVLHGVAQGLRRLGGVVSVGASQTASVTVSVDPSHVSNMVDIIGGRLGLAEEVPVTVDVSAEIGDGGRLIVTIDGHETDDSSEGDVEQLLDWALAQRVAALHGGRLLWEAAGAKEHRVVLLLPTSMGEREE